MSRFRPLKCYHSSCKNACCAKPKLSQKRLIRYNNLTKKRGMIMPQSYEPEFRKKIVRLHLEEGRTYKSITAEYGVSKASISKWCREFSEECRAKAQSNPEA